jgi:oligosaccharide repeat unit polymerase
MIISRSIILLVISWSVYLINAVQTKSYFIYISLNSTILIICFILAIFIGSVVFNLNNYSNKDKLNLSNYKSLLIRNEIFNFSLVGYFSILLIIFLRKIFFYFFYDIELGRSQLFSPISRDPHFFSVIYVFLIFSKSIFSTFLSFFFIKFLFQKKYFKIILITIGVIFETFIFLSKGLLISILFLLTLYIFLLKLEKPNIKLFLKLFSYIFIVVLIIYMVEINRDNNLILTIKEYLLISPTLLSSVVDNTFQVFYNKWSFDNIFIIFSGLDYLITVLLRGFGFSIQTYGYEIIKFLDIDQVVSLDTINHGFLIRNTFYSILLEPYLSFGFWGVIILGFSVGYIISKYEYTYTKYNCDYSLFYLQFFVGCIFFGIFGSAFSTVTFWLVLFVVIFFKSFIFSKNSNS